MSSILQFIAWHRSLRASIAGWIGVFVVQALLGGVLCFGLLTLAGVPNNGIKIYLSVAFAASSGLGAIGFAFIWAILFLNIANLVTGLAMGMWIASPGWWAEAAADWEAGAVLPFYVAAALAAVPLIYVGTSYAVHRVWVSMLQNIFGRLAAKKRASEIEGELDASRAVGRVTALEAAAYMQLGDEDDGEVRVTTKPPIQRREGEAGKAGNGAENEAAGKEGSEATSSIYGDLAVEGMDDALAGLGETDAGSSGDPADPKPDASAKPIIGSIPTGLAKRAGVKQRELPKDVRQMLQYLAEGYEEALDGSSEPEEAATRFAKRYETKLLGLNDEHFAYLRNLAAGDGQSIIDLAKGMQSSQPSLETTFEASVAATAQIDDINASSITRSGEDAADADASKAGGDADGDADADVGDDQDEKLTLSEAAGMKKGSRIASLMNLALEEGALGAMENAEAMKKEPATGFGFPKTEKPLEPAQDENDTSGADAMAKALNEARYGTPDGPEAAKAEPGQVKPAPQQTKPESEQPQSEQPNSSSLEGFTIETSDDGGSEDQSTPKAGDPAIKGNTDVTNAVDEKRICSDLFLIMGGSLPDEEKRRKLDAFEHEHGKILADVVSSDLFAKEVGAETARKIEQQIAQIKRAYEPADFAALDKESKGVEAKIESLLDRTQNLSMAVLNPLKARVGALRKQLDQLSADGLVPFGGEGLAVQNRVINCEGNLQTLFNVYAANAKPAANVDSEATREAIASTGSMLESLKAGKPVHGHAPAATQPQAAAKSAGAPAVSAPASAPPEMSEKLAALAAQLPASLADLRNAIAKQEKWFEHPDLGDIEADPMLDPIDKRIPGYVAEVTKRALLLQLRGAAREAREAYRHNNLDVEAARRELQAWADQNAKVRLENDAFRAELAARTETLEDGERRLSVREAEIAEREASVAQIEESLSGREGQIAEMTAKAREYQKVAAFDQVGGLSELQDLLVKYWTALPIPPRFEEIRPLYLKLQFGRAVEHSAHTKTWAPFEQINETPGSEDFKPHAVVRNITGGSYFDVARELVSRIGDIIGDEVTRYEDMPSLIDDKVEKEFVGEIVGHWRDCRQKHSEVEKWVERLRDQYRKAKQTERYEEQGVDRLEIELTAARKDLDELRSQLSGAEAALKAKDAELVEAKKALSTPSTDAQATSNAAEAGVEEPFDSMKLVKEVLEVFEKERLYPASGSGEISLRDYAVFVGLSATDEDRRKRIKAMSEVSGKKALLFTKTAPHVIDQLFRAEGIQDPDEQYSIKPLSGDAAMNFLQDLKGEVDA